MTWRLATRRSLVLAAVAAGLLLPAGANASPTVSANLPATLAATSMAVTVFQYHGLTTVTTAAGTFQAMEFAMATTTMIGFNLVAPCEAHAGGGVRQQMGATTATATSAITTLHVTTLTATVSDPPPLGSLPAVVNFTVATPPIVGVPILLGDAGTLSGFKATLADGSSGSMSFDHLNLQAFFC